MSSVKIDNKTHNIIDSIMSDDNDDKLDMNVSQYTKKTINVKTNNIKDSININSKNKTQNKLNKNQDHNKDIIDNNDIIKEDLINKENIDIDNNTHTMDKNIIPLNKNISSFLKNIFTDYDIFRQKYLKFDTFLYNSFYKKTISFEYTDNDIEYNIMKITENDKIIFKSRYEILGFYNKAYNTWTWSWNNPALSKNSSRLATGLLKYGLNLEPGVNDYLRTILINGKIWIDQDIQCEIYRAISWYLLKNKYVTGFFDYNSVDFFILLDVDNYPQLL